MNLDALRYPIGKDQLPQQIDSTHHSDWAETIRDFPARVNELVKDLSPAELAYIYRPEGWSIKQVVHHCADSHMNALTRFKLALTEEKPVIKPYKEALWAEFDDATNDDLSASIKMLEGIHSRWSNCVSQMNSQDFERPYYHPDQEALVPLGEALGHYDWHCRHHLAHIQQAIKFKNDFTNL
ncbi:YfiT family bacillithiol transferase [Gilvibacter sp.]|uniref:YfiT family bacillithiol transferase n=1 Tax=Gilvibacter sp. TaxID=2729997 RepID=UPI0025B8B79E|nr:putative metal-dependent hydrolase [Gilvibacter sp.]NQX78717.1 putative metal-dependent hydrolase [Gilvibacter sp.]